MPIWDYIIVGGGSAGCVLANRLSASSANRVLLLEAGEDHRPGTEPDEIKDVYPYRASFNPRYQWPGLKVYFQPVPHNDSDRPPLCSYGQARIMGGGSSINGELANRGTPDDYDEWASLGAQGWDWNSVLPYFRRLESDLDFHGPLHGNDGPIIISRTHPCEYGLLIQVKSEPSRRPIGCQADLATTTVNMSFGDRPLSSDVYRNAICTWRLGVSPIRKPGLIQADMASEGCS